MPRSSPIGQSIYDDVEKLRADNPGMSQQAAFQALAGSGDAKRSVASIAANYYRIARKVRGGKKRRVVRRSSRPVVAAVRPTTNGQVEDIDLDKLESDLMQAVAVVRATKKRMAEVEAMEQRLEVARRALA